MDLNGIINGIGTVLTPVKWVIEAILVGFHWFFTYVLHMDPDAGLTWVLSIVGLTVVVRAALIPIFVRQIKSQRKMMEIAPQLKKIQDKYRGKKDQFSREAMQRETMEMYRKAGTNPFASCLPLLIQMPVFFSLLPTLNEAKPDAQGHFHAGVGLFNIDLVKSFYHANLFGVAPLKDSIQTAWGTEWTVVIIAAIIVVLMTASQFITQLQLVSKNMSPETKASPMYRQQRMLLYILPLIFIFSGFAFPIGAMFYWLTSNVWTLVQQYLVIRNMPTPGSEAALAREARLAKRARARAIARGEDPDAPASSAAGSEADVPKKTTTQRQQPVNRNRAKKGNARR